VRCHGKEEDYLREREANTNESVKKSKAGSPAKKANIRRSKSREERQRTLPEEIQHLIEQSSDSDQGGNDDDVEFETSVSLTSNLAEFGHTPLPPKRGRKAKKQKRVMMTDDLVNEGDVFKEPGLGPLESQMVAACKTGDESALALAVEELDEIGNLAGKINVQYGHTKTSPLHLAAAGGHRGSVRLLLRRGADPCLKDRAKKVPYQLCPDKETRNAFRAFRGERPEAHDWTKAQIPEPPSQEAEERQREKRLRQKQAKKDKAKAQKEEKAKMEAEEAERRRYLGLSDREKRALAAERRILAASLTATPDVVPMEPSPRPVLSRCFQCAKDISGKVPFEYCANVFCQMSCLKEHKQRSQRQENK